RVGDLHKPCFRLKFRDCAHTAISHSGSQAGDQLRDHGREWPFKRHATFDTFGNKLSRQFLVLAIAGPAALLHRSEPTHSPVSLESSRLRRNGFSGAVSRSDDTSTNLSAH